MPDNATYPLFCPVAMAADLIEPRWTLLILSEMWCGSTRFSQIHRGVPGMSPALLSKRLRDMQAKGLVARATSSRGAYAEYVTTPLADRLEPIVELLGRWAHENVDSAVSLRDLDPRTLMWNVRRKINQGELPLRDCVIQFTLNEGSKPAVLYWIVIKPGREPDLCSTNPGFDVDLFIVCDLRALTSAWIGHSTFHSEIEAGRISLIGHAGLARTMTRWMVRSCYATTLDDAVPDRAAAA